MNLSDSKKKLALAGVLCGLVAACLAYFGNPANMAFCIACFIRDTAGALGFHQAEVVQYARPEIIGLVIGAFIISVATKEYRSTAGSSPMIRFILGMVIMIGSLIFLGCPLRMVIRMSAGDLNAWVAFVGLLDGHPYEIFTGLQDDEEGISLPKSVTTGRIIKNIDEEGNKRYDFQFENKRGYKTTIEGLSEKFNKEYWNYAKLISGVLRWRMPIDRVIKLVDSLQLDSENINTWKNGVERALKKYVTDGTSAEGQKCPNCGNETLVYQEGCLICKTCGTSRCG